MKLKPLYFPFTYIGGATLQALRACFETCTVCQPSRRRTPDAMRAWADDGVLDIRIPVEGDEEKLDAVAGDFRSWIHLHAGGEISALKALGDRPPFFDDTLISQIRSEIENRKKKEPHHTAGDPDDESPIGRGGLLEHTEALFQHRVFLLFAQDYDLCYEAITRDMERLEQQERVLFKNLLREDDPSEAGFTAARIFSRAATDDYMTPQRLEAWAQLMKSDLPKTPFFVTSSRAALEHLIDRAPGAQLASRFDAVPMYPRSGENLENWRSGLLARIEAIATTDQMDFETPIAPPPAGSADNRTVSLALYRIPATRPEEVFAVHTKTGLEKIPPKQPNPAYSHTVLGWLQV